MRPKTPAPSDLDDVETSDAEWLRRAARSCLEVVPGALAAIAILTRAGTRIVRLEDPHRHFTDVDVARAFGSSERRETVRATHFTWSGRMRRAIPTGARRTRRATVSHHEGRAFVSVRLVLGERAVYLSAVVSSHDEDEAAPEANSESLGPEDQLGGGSRSQTISRRRVPRAASRS
jgi:hypothetical protein